MNKLLTDLQKPIECTSTILEYDPTSKTVLRFSQWGTLDLSKEKFTRYSILGSTNIYLFTPSHPFRGDTAPMVVQCTRSGIETYTFADPETEYLYRQVDWIDLGKIDYNSNPIC